MVGWDNAVTEFTELWKSVPTRLADIKDCKAEGTTLFNEAITLDDCPGGAVIRYSTRTACCPASFLVNEFGKTDKRLLQLPATLQVLLTCLGCIPRWPAIALAQASQKTWLDAIRLASVQFVVVTDNDVTTISTGDPGPLGKGSVVAVLVIVVAVLVVVVAVLVVTELVVTVLVVTVVVVVVVAELVVVELVVVELVVAELVVVELKVVVVVVWFNL